MCQVRSRTRPGTEIINIYLEVSYWSDAFRLEHIQLTLLSALSHAKTSVRRLMILGSFGAKHMLRRQYRDPWVNSDIAFEGLNNEDRGNKQRAHYPGGKNISLCESEMFRIVIFHIQPPCSEINHTGDYW